jgi:hypothetical protein
VNNGERKEKFAERLATLIDGAISNHIISKGKNPGSATRQKFREASITKLAIYYPAEASALKGFLTWQSQVMTGTSVVETGRIPNRDVPTEYKEGLELYGMVNGRLASRGRIRARGVEGFHHKAREGKATVVEIPFEGSERQQRYANCVSTGWVPSDEVVSQLMGINVRSLEIWRDSLSAEWEFTKFEWGWTTTLRPKVDLAKLQELVKGLSQDDLQALTELLSEQG